MGEDSALWAMDPDAALALAVSTPSGDSRIVTARFAVSKLMLGNPWWLEPVVGSLSSRHVSGKLLPSAPNEVAVSIQTR